MSTSSAAARRAGFERASSRSTSSRRRWFDTKRPYHGPTVVRASADAPTPLPAQVSRGAADAPGVCPAARVRELSLAALLVGCAGTFSSAPPDAPGSEAAPAAVRALRVRVAPEVAIVTDGDVGAGLTDRLRHAVELELGHAGLTVVAGDETRDVLVRIEARVRGAVYFLHGHVTLTAEHAGVVVGMTEGGSQLFKEQEFAPETARLAVRALLRTDALVAFAEKRNPPAHPTAVAAAAPAPSEAAPSPAAVAAAKQHAKQGTAYYNLDRPAEALAAYEAAYLAIPDAALLFNIAQCHRKLGHDKEALAFYRTYLRNAPKAPNRAEVEKRIRELEPGRLAATTARRH
jgi:hypothetical protein